jgi:hypothetical protein
VEGAETDVNSGELVMVLSCVVLVTLRSREGSIVLVSNDVSRLEVLTLPELTIVLEYEVKVNID